MEADKSKISVVVIYYWFLRNYINDCLFYRRSLARRLMKNNFFQHLLGGVQVPDRLRAAAQGAVVQGRDRDHQGCAS